MKYSLAFTILICISCTSFFAPNRMNASSNDYRTPLLYNNLFKVSILYPNGEGKTFDHNYYETRHMPMVAGYLGTNLEYYEIEKGLSGRTANDKPTYLAIGSFYVKDLAAYNTAIGQHRDSIISDFKNYTNIQPVIQISEVKKSTTTHSE